MKKSYVKYLLLIVLLLSFNLLCFIIAFSLYELNSMLNDIIDDSTILLFLISNVILFGFIKKYSLSINKSVAVIYLVLVIIRTFEVFYFESTTGLSYCSFMGVGALLNIVTAQGNDWIYWWTVIVFPICQPLFVLLLYKIMTKITHKDSIFRSK